MKQLLRLSLLMLSVCLLMGLTSCHPKNKKQVTETENVVTQQEFSSLLTPMAITDVEHMIAVDRQDMFDTHKAGNFQWFSTGLVLSGNLDEADAETIGVMSVTNEFHYLIGNGFDTEMLFYNHTSNGIVKTNPVSAYLTDRNPLGDIPIKLTFANAFVKAKQSNILLPHSRHVALVFPLNDNNPIYVFGNRKDRIAVDAVTGEVYVYNGPLGEWP